MLLDRTVNYEFDARAPCPFGDQALQSVKQFLLREARLLDERDFATWLSLWKSNGVYWVPRFHRQPDPFEHISLIYEDATLRETRVRRLQNPRNWSQQPITHSTRLIGNIQIDGLDAEGFLIVRSSVILTEWRLEQRTLAGTVFHKLEKDSLGDWRIYIKRINLVNCDSIFGNLEVFI